MGNPLTAAATTSTDTLASPTLEETEASESYKSDQIMSGKGQSREVVSKGTNSQGNEYTSYSDGAYRYTNETSTGGNTKYYNTGNGHGFYENKGGSKESGGQPYKTHYNYNQGTSNNF